MKTITKWSGPTVTTKSSPLAARSLKCLFNFKRIFYSKTAVNGGTTNEKLNAKRKIFYIFIKGYTIIKKERKKIKN